MTGRTLKLKVMIRIVAPIDKSSFLPKLSNLVSLNPLGMIREASMVVSSVIKAKKPSLAADRVLTSSRLPNKTS